MGLCYRLIPICDYAYYKLLESYTHTKSAFIDQVEMQTISFFSFVNKIVILCTDK